MKQEMLQEQQLQENILLQFHHLQSPMRTILHIQLIK